MCPIHLNFMAGARDIREAIAPLLPLILALAGAGAGVCGAMLYLHDPRERAHVYLQYSLPVAIAGLVGGAVAGQAVAAACTRRPRLVPAAEVAAATILGAAVVAPLGWIVGDLRAERLGAEGMAIGAVVGAAIGLVLGVVQTRPDRRQLTEPPGPDPAVANYRERPDGSAAPVDDPHRDRPA